VKSGFKRQFSSTGQFHRPTARPSQRNETLLHLSNLSKVLRCLTVRFSVLFRGRRCIHQISSDIKCAVILPFSASCPPCTSGHFSSIMLSSMPLSLSRFGLGIVAMFSLFPQLGHGQVIFFVFMEKCIVIHQAHQSCRDFEADPSACAT